MRKTWTQDEKQYLAKHYPNTPNKDLAKTIKSTPERVCAMAGQLGVRKSDEYRKASTLGRFTGGNKPWNKGVSYQPDNQEHRFKKGHTAVSHSPVGTIIKRGSRYQIKVTEKGSRWHQWRPLAEYVWVAAGNEPPSGSEVIAFKDGYRPKSSDCFTIDRLHKITRAKNLANNSIHNYPKELVQAIRALTNLKKEIEKNDDSN